MMIEVLKPSRYSVKSIRKFVIILVLVFLLGLVMIVALMMTVMRFPTGGVNQNDEDAQ